MIVLDSIAKGTYCFHYFSHGAGPSLHRHSFRFLHLCQVFLLRGKRS